MNKWILILLAIVAFCGISYIINASPVWSKVVNICGV